MLSEEVHETRARDREHAFPSRSTTVRQRTTPPPPRSGSEPWCICISSPFLTRITFKADERFDQWIE